LKEQTMADHDRWTDERNYGRREGGFGRPGRGDYRSRGWEREEGFRRRDDQDDVYRDEGGAARGYGQDAYGADWDSYGPQMGAYRSEFDHPYRDRGYGAGRSDYDRNSSRWAARREDEDRSWWDRTTDEVSSWFGDEEAERRRRMDALREGEHRGRGPKGYSRSDDRIRDDVNDRLTDDAWLDASDIEVQVEAGEVTLSGNVERRQDKRRAEDIAERISGVKHVQNNIRCRQAGLPITGSTAGAKAKSKPGERATTTQ